MTHRFSKFEIERLVRRGIAIIEPDETEATMEIEIAHQAQIEKRKWPAVNGRALIASVRRAPDTTHLLKLITDSRTDYAPYFSKALQTAYDWDNEPCAIILAACGAHPYIIQLSHRLVFRKQIEVAKVRTSLAILPMILNRLPALLQIELMLAVGEPFSNVFDFSFLWTLTLAVRSTCCTDCQHSDQP